MVPAGGGKANSETHLLAGIDRQKDQNERARTIDQRAEAKDANRQRQLDIVAKHAVVSVT